MSYGSPDAPPRTPFRQFSPPERVQSGAGDGQVIALNNREFVDLHFQLFAGATYQNALLLQRADQLQNPADIVNGSAADLLGAFHYDLRTDPVTGEQFLQQCAIFLIADQDGSAVPHCDRLSLPHAGSALCRSCNRLSLPATQRAHGLR